MDTYYVQRVKHMERLADSLEQSMSDNSYCDVTLQCGEEALRAHQVILASSSPYFRSCFAHVPPGHYPIVFLKDVQPEDMKKMLEFIYKGGVTVPHQQLRMLVKLADLLGVSGLNNFNLDSYADDNNDAPMEQYCPSSHNQNQSNESVKNASTNGSSLSESTSTPAVKIPKKRGRKPKHVIAREMAEQAEASKMQANAERQSNTAPVEPKEVRRVRQRVSDGSSDETEAGRRLRGRAKDEQSIKRNENTDEDKESNNATQDDKPTQQVEKAAEGINAQVKADEKKAVVYEVIKIEDSSDDSQVIEAGGEKSTTDAQQSRQIDATLANGHTQDEVTAPISISAVPLKSGTPPPPTLPEDKREQRRVVSPSKQLDIRSFYGTQMTNGDGDANGDKSSSVSLNSNGARIVKSKMCPTNQQIFDNKFVERLNRTLNNTASRVVPPLSNLYRQKLINAQQQAALAMANPKPPGRPRGRPRKYTSLTIIPSSGASYNSINSNAMVSSASLAQRAPMGGSNRMAYKAPPPSTSTPISLTSSPSMNGSPTNGQRRLVNRIETGNISTPIFNQQRLSVLNHNLKIASQAPPKSSPASTTPTTDASNNMHTNGNGNVYNNNKPTTSASSSPKIPTLTIKTSGHQAAVVKRGRGRPSNASLRLQRQAHQQRMAEAAAASFQAAVEATEFSLIDNSNNFVVRPPSMS